MLIQSDLTELTKGNIIDHFLMIGKIEIRNTKAGKKFLSMELGDKSGSINTNVWNDTAGFDSIADNGKVGDIIKVLGSIDEFQGVPQIKVTSIRLNIPADNVEVQDFLPRSARDPEVMKKELLVRIEEISNTHLKELLKNIFSGERMEKFKTAPAGKSWHHGYIHGLIEHTLEMIKICDLMCDFHPAINRDLLAAGAILHDFGKTEELSYDSSFNYSDKGKLIGHIVICASMIEEETKKLTDFPEGLKNLLIHLILSHQGKLEYASPVVPKTVEAIALYQADELSAKVNAYVGVINSDMTIEGNWTKFIHLAQTDLYKYNLSEESEKKINKSLFD
ncbi:MAG: HD domain-containing protein [Bacteroidetes bacterium]|nr:HD domain-containing protein [Bacteroidota bacterium]MCH8033378.1 HD domain-containing protein [Bacteroidota bacterium]